MLFLLFRRCFLLVLSYFRFGKIAESIGDIFIVIKLIGKIIGDSFISVMHIIVSVLKSAVFIRIIFVLIRIIIVLVNVIIVNVIMVLI